MKTNKRTEQALRSFAEMMIKRMNQMKDSQWEKPWIELRHEPVNFEGKTYNGMNTLFLSIDTICNQHPYPIYVTIKQANRMGARVNKGAESTPILFWERIYKDDSGNTVHPDTLRAMTDDERAALRASNVLKVYNVFNVAQTNLEEKQPEKLAKLKELFMPAEGTTRGMYKNAQLDNMLKKQSWVCPIQLDKQLDSAFYAPTRDYIAVPAKARFRKHSKKEEVYADGQRFYATLIHEMAHSTGHKDRLNRGTIGHKYGSHGYGMEELIAELTSALVGLRLGFRTEVTDSSAVYLDSWAQAICHQPDIILTVMGDVSRAARMIMEKVLE